MGDPSRHGGDAAVRSAIEPVVTALGLDLEDLDVQSSGRRRRVSVVVDRDGGIDLDGIAAASRAVSDALDSTDAMGDQPYTLEVTSPGIDRPLTLPRHWRRNIGRRVRVFLADGTTWDGRITGADDDALVVAADERRAAEVTERRTSWPDVVRGEVQVEFKRPEQPPSGDHEADQEEA